MQLTIGLLSGIMSCSSSKNPLSTTGSVLRSYNFATPCARMGFRPEGISGAGRTGNQRFFLHVNISLYNDQRLH